jgi:hypothetical protein
MSLASALFFSLVAVSNAYGLYRLEGRERMLALASKVAKKKDL